ncbi:alpha-enolase isoform X2, partial [Sigmodon hispidus]
MDMAATESFRYDKYNLDFKSPDDYSRYILTNQLAGPYKSFIRDYPVISIKNPFHQDDWKAWWKFTISADNQVVENDLIVNQIGSVTKFLQ